MIVTHHPIAHHLVTHHPAGRSVRLVADGDAWSSASPPRSDGRRTRRRHRILTGVAFAIAGVAMGVVGTPDRADAALSDLTYVENSYCATDQDARWTASSRCG